MDEIDLSLKMRRLAAWLDRRCQPDSLIRKQFYGPPFGGCYVTIDPDRQGPFASANLNRVYLCGTEVGMDFDSVARFIDLFATEGVKRFFVWLSPGPNMDVVRRWLEGSGLSRIRRTGYLTAAATAESHRKRGAQQALIAKRVERAERIGCSLLVSETLYMIEHSYRNLQRAGFQEVYEKEVYEWSS